MKILALVGHLFYKNKKAYALLSFEIVITAIIFLVLIGKIQFRYESEDITYTFQDSNAYYFVPHLFFSEREQSLEDILDEKCKFNYQLGEVYNIVLEDDGGNTITAYGYNDAIINQVDLEIKAGNWFRDAKKENYIPVVSVDNQYKVGDVITITNSNQKAEKLYVIGELDKSSYVLTFMTGASTDYARLSCFISKSEAQLIIPVNSEIYPTLSESGYLYKSKQLGTIIIVEDNEIHNEIYEICSDYGTISNVTVMKENYQKDMQDFYITNGIVLFIFTILTLIGIGGFNGIQSLINERTYTIYYMLGLSRKKCMLVETMKTAFLLIINYLIIVILYIWKIRNILNGNEFKITSETFLIIFIYLFMICLASSVGYVYQLGKKNLIQVYKRKA